MMDKYICVLLICCILLMLAPVLGGCSSYVEQLTYTADDFSEPTEITEPITQESWGSNAEYADFSSGNYADSQQTPESRADVCTEPIGQKPADEGECFHSKQEDESYGPGVIMGDIFFESFKLCKLFVGAVSDVLPPPNGHREYVFFFFDGFEIVAMSGLDGVASSVHIWPPNLSSLTINGTELDNDMTREDVRFLLGEPTERSGEWMLEYRISSLTRDSWLIFNFTCPNKDATIHSVAMQ